MKHRPDFQPFSYADAVAIYEGRRVANNQIPQLLHRTIAQNWLLHALLEISGRYEEILAPELTVADPHYDFFLDNHPLDGREAVRGLYSGLVSSASTAIVSDAQRYAVADWGFCSEQVNHQYTTADGARRLGLEVDDTADCFVIHKPVAMVWTYTPDALLIGEVLYFAPLSAWGWTRLGAAHYLSTAGMARALSPLIDACRADHEASRRQLLASR